MIRHYEIKFFVDRREENRVIDRRICFGTFETNQESLRLALLELISKLTLFYDYEKIFVGVSMVICDDVIMGDSYKNKVIYSNNLLKECFYC